MDKKQKAEKAALYLRLHQSAYGLWEFFRQCGDLKFLEEGRLPNASEWSEMEPFMDKLQAAIESGAEANSEISSLPRATKPFFNIIPLLLLYFRSLQACLAEYKPGMEESSLGRCKEQLADCRNMAEELDRQWQEWNDLLKEAALMLNPRQNQAEGCQLASAEEDGALAQFIASSRMKRGF